MTLPQLIEVWQLEHRGPDGARITGETWDFSGCRKPNATAFTPTATEPFNDGRYRFTWNADAYGNWVFEAQAQSDPTNDDYDYSVVVTVTDPATDAQPVADAVLAASVTGGAANTVAAKLNEIGTTTVDATVPIEANPSAIPIIRGNTYSNTIGNAIDFTHDEWPNLTGANVTMQIATITGTSYSLPMTVITPTGEAEVRLEMTSATTAAFPVFVGQYEIVAVLSGGATSTLATGTFYAKD